MDKELFFCSHEIVTLEHPFYELTAAPWLTAGATQGRWTPAGELKAGDHIQQADGTTGIVEAVVFENTQQLMYNLTVADAHTFFVGDGEWLVHNSESCPIGWINAARKAQSLVGNTGYRNPTIGSSVAGTILTHSGYKHRPGFKHPGISNVMQFGQRIGHVFQPSNADLLGVPGSYFASHAEVQLSVLMPNRPLGVSNQMCEQCWMYFSKLATHNNYIQVVADPFHIHVFYPGGSIEHYLHWLE